MNRILLIFSQAYWGNLTRKSYLVLTFGLPLLLVLFPVVIGGLGALVIQSARPPDDPRPIAIVDLTPNQLFADLESFGADPAPLKGFGSEAAAEAALASGEIQSYYIFPEDYWETGEIRADYVAQPNLEATSRFENWVRRQVRRQVTDPQILARYDRGATIAHLDLAGNEAFDDDNLLEWSLLFALIYIARVIGIFTSGYMYNSIAEEARNRTMEILLTSVSAVQFVTGKLFGLLAVGLTQIAIWVSVPLILLAIYSNMTDSALIALLFRWEQLPLVVSLLFGAYLLDQLFAAAAGILRVTGGAGPQLINAINWVTLLTLVYAANIVPPNPHAPLAVVASIFPLTAPIVMLTRVVASEVPTWQIVLSQLFLWGSAVATLFLLGRLIRRNMVAYAPRFALIKWLIGRLRQGVQNKIGINRKGAR